MSNKFHKLIVRAFFILLLITGVSAAYYFWPTTKERDYSVVRQLADYPQNDNGTTIGDSSAPSADYSRSDTAPDPSGLYGTNNETTIGDSSAVPRNDSETTNDTATDNSADSRFRGNDTIAQRYDITIIAGDKTYPLSVASSTTVYEAMRLLQIDSRQPFQFSAKEYSGIGYFVEEINGVKNDPAANTYWIMYVNGQSATVGASAYILKPNDTITWKFEKAKF